MKQKTISKEIIIRGKGLHYGENAELIIKPAAPNSGYIFKRTDIFPNQIIEAIVENVGECKRCTTISKNNYSISTIEHLLSATYAIGIDNILFELNGREVPILDGSAKSFINFYKQTEIIKQDAELKIYNINEEINYKNTDLNIEISLSPSNNFEIEYFANFPFNYPSQNYKLDDLKNFEQDISKARTFVFISEIEQLAKAGMIKGGDIDNAIIIIDKQFTQTECDNLSKLLNKPKFPFQKVGEVLNNVELFYPNELARHKLLDLLGDLALTGFRFNANIKAKRSGHYFNTIFAKKIKNYIQNYKK